MAPPVRATCPGCRSVLKIPAEWADRPVKCKACGAVVRATATPVAILPPPAPVAPVAPVAKPLPQAVASPAAVPVEYALTDEYTPHAEALPTAFEASETTKKHSRRKRKTPYLTYALLAGGLIAVAVGGALFGKPLYEKFAGKDAAQTPTTEAKVTPPAVNANFANAAKRFPRRMLVVSVTKYLYCNTLSAGNSKNEDMVSIAARRLAYQWKVPMDKDSDQLFVLQDAGAKPRPMLKPTIEQAVEQFCATSRPQDRVTIYFGGHATEVEGKAYLVPVDGDLTDAATLIPLADFWAKVKACPAQQKLVVFDVGRLNEDGDKLRPGSEALSESLEKLLQAAPDGVQVLTTAGPGLNALEYRNAPPDAPDEGGSLFLSSVIALAAKGKLKAAKEPTPDEPLPVEAWFDAAKERMAVVAKVSGKPDPAPKLTKPTPGEAVAYNGDEPAATRFEFAAPPKGMAVSEVARIIAPISKLPPYRGKLTKDDALEGLVPYADDVMKGYAPDAVSLDAIRKDADKYPIRHAALTSLELIQKEWKSSVEGSTELRTQIPTGTNDAFKKAIMREQETPARITEELETAITKAEKQMPKLDEEPSKYWRVMYLSALAQLKARLAFMSEYNLALGSIRTDNIPKVDEAKGQSGLILVSTEKMKSKKEVKDLAESAVELFDKIAAEHKGTPWAIQAKRYRVIALGLEWKPYTAGNSKAIE